MPSPHRVQRVPDTGTAVLVSGSKVVDDSRVTAHTMIVLTAETPGGTQGALYVSARTAGTSFTIHSTSGSDSSTVRYALFEPVIQATT